jgi:DNA-binding NarL/FixJ family response regulator
MFRAARLTVPKAVTVVLVDDIRLPRRGAVAGIRSLPGVLVLALAAEIELAVQQVREAAPDIALLNLEPEGEDALTLAGALHGEVPDAGVIIMGVTPSIKVAGLICAGVSGFIMAEASFEKCLQTINAVADGTRVLPLELTRSLFGQLGRRVPARPRKTLDVEHLTPRQRLVADLIVAGLSTEEIARRLRIVQDTARNHVHQVLSRLAVNGRLEVAAFSQGRPGSVAAPGLHLSI